MGEYKPKLDPMEIAKWIKEIQDPIHIAMEAAVDANIIEDLEHYLGEMRSQHSFQQGASIITARLGGEYPDEVRRAELEYMEALIKCIKARKKVKDTTIEHYERKTNNLDLLRAMGLDGGI